MKLVLLLEIVLSIIPALSSYTFSILIGTSISTYTGSYTHMFGMVDVCCVALCYYWTFYYRRQRRNKSGNKAGAVVWTSSADAVVTITHFDGQWTSGIAVLKQEKGGKGGGKSVR